ncbi:MAG: hypothetical protein QM692_09030, partial [Thermomicrobiales bacterium]
MDCDTFDAATRLLKPVRSRRGLAGLLGGAGLFALALAAPADAKRKRKKRRKKKKQQNVNPGGGNPGNQQPPVVVNPFGCVNVGNFCQTAAQCCSGICQNSRCAAHDASTCQAGQSDFTCSGVNTNVDCLVPGNNDGLCVTTTGN